MTFVTLRPDEAFPDMLRRFLRAFQASGILAEARARRHFTPNHERRRAKLRRARRRALRGAGR